MLKNFRTYQLSVIFYKECKNVKLPCYLRDQILRASSSISLNLSEGSVKPTKKDKLKFYNIAFASLREVQAVIELEDIKSLSKSADILEAHLYKLTRQ